MHNERCTSGSGEGRPGQRPAAPEVVTQPGIHTLAIKLSYWFG